jgi:hypothetical protein
LVSTLSAIEDHGLLACGLLSLIRIDWNFDQYLITHNTTIELTLRVWNFSSLARGVDLDNLEDVEVSS